MAPLSISSIVNNSTSISSLYLQPEKAGVRQEFERSQYPVQLSEQAKQLLSNQSQMKEDEGKESVQVSSSIGRTARITGLHREDITALYRSIDKLT